MKHRADWFAWVLQFVVGLAVGASVGKAIISEGRDLGQWLALDSLSTFIWGAALIGAGVASFYGDRLWLHEAHQHVVGPDGGAAQPQQPPRVHRHRCRGRGAGSQDDCWYGHPMKFVIKP